MGNKRNGGSLNKEMWKNRRESETRVSERETAKCKRQRQEEVLP